MAAHSTRPNAALALAGSWLLTLSLSTLAVAVLLLSASNWHAVRDQLQQLSLWQSWISIAACAGLLVISRKNTRKTSRNGRKVLYLFMCWVVC